MTHDVPGGERFLREGLQSAVGMPIHVNGGLWASRRRIKGGLAAGRQRAADDGVHQPGRHRGGERAKPGRAATSRDELARPLAEQAALRRVATLVARGIDPGEIFSAVAEEIRGLLDADNTGIGHFETDGSVVVVGSVGEEQVTRPIGTRVELRDYHAPAVVWRTGRAAQTDEDAWRNASDPGRRRPAQDGDPVDGGESDLRRRPPVGSSERADQARAVSVGDRRPDGGLHRADRYGDRERGEPTELAASRARIVAAADETRRRIERDLNDGTQQRLASLGLELRLAQSLVPAGRPDLQAEIAKVADELNGTVEDLREITHGIHPAILSEGGLGPALRTLARRAAIPVDLDVTVIGRLPEPVEVAAYYVCSEALTNATRHGHASVVELSAEASGGTLRMCVRDDGVGGADLLAGSGLVGLKDRIEALGGTFSVHSPAGRGTTVCCELPVLAGPD